MNMGFYKPKGRKGYRVWFRWNGKPMKINKALDGSKLDTIPKCEAVLKKLEADIESGMFDLNLWRIGNKYKNEWEKRQLEPRYDTVDICDICGERIKVCQDHDHRNHFIRGKLCRSCNLSLGIMKENKENLLNAVRYLLFWEKQDSNRISYTDWKKEKNNGGAK